MDGAYLPHMYDRVAGLKSARRLVQQREGRKADGRRRRKQHLPRLESSFTVIILHKQPPWTLTGSLAPTNVHLPASRAKDRWHLALPPQMRRHMVHILMKAQVLVSRLRPSPSKYLLEHTVFTALKVAFEARVVQYACIIATTKSPCIPVPMNLLTFSRKG